MEAEQSQGAESSIRDVNPRQPAKRPESKFLRRSRHCNGHPTHKLKKSRSLYGVNPSSNLGPAALVQGATLTIPDPSAQRLEWCKTPLGALVIKKLGDSEIYDPYVQTIKYLISKDLFVYIEEGHLDLSELEQTMRNKVMQFRPFQDDLTGKVDFIVTLGGDGTLIHTSSLFQQSVPPVLAFNMGSLGFLTPFDSCTIEKSIDQALSGNAPLMLRSRLKCAILTKDQSDSVHHVKDLEKPTLNHATYRAHSVLNEVVIDRGPSPYLCHVDLFVDNMHVTSVQGDGIIISTTTGSTAYATAAGASMVHPSVPALLITPICAHSLSFRPIVLPAGVEVKVMVSEGSRNTAWAAFDGRNRTEIGHGEFVRITTSIYPLPSICSEGQLPDWFCSLAECLNWNVRKSQKALQPPMSSIASVSSLSSLSLDNGKADLTDSLNNVHEASTASDEKHH